MLGMVFLARLWPDDSVAAGLNMSVLVTRPQPGAAETARLLLVPSPAAQQQPSPAIS